MAEEYDEESEDESEDDELLEEMESERESKKSKKKTSSKENKEEEEKAQDVWVAFHQPEIVGIRNTLTGDLIQGFQDAGVVQAMALVLNMQERFNTSLA